jgi:hypothetical protein
MHLTNASAIVTGGAGGFGTVAPRWPRDVMRWWRPE